jgi:DNA-binding MurR/RpiR family transcriptional regulator
MLIRDRIEANAERMTASERKLAATLLADYPYSGLSSIQKLAEHAEVSPPSISRFVAKIGLPGYQEFQDQLMTELKEGQRSPVQVHQRGRSIEGGYLSDFISRAAAQMSVSADAITEAQFDRICQLLINPKHDVYVLGGRISNTIAQHISFHLRQSRSGVYHLPDNSEVWPEYLLRMKQGDVLFLVDFRRYQRALEDLADKAVERVGARVILMTDKWMSPISAHAAEILPVHIESGTLWDTYAPALSIAEAIVTRIAEDNFDVTSARIEAWDALRAK